MSIFKSSAALAFMALAISSCGGRSTKDSHNSDNAEQVNEQLPPVSQLSDSLNVMEVTETEMDSIDFYEAVVLDSTPLTTYKRLRPENEADWIGHLMFIDLPEFTYGIYYPPLNVFIKFDTEVNGYTVTCRFMPSDNYYTTGPAIWNFRNDTSDLYLFHPETVFYQTQLMCSSDAVWKNMDTYEFNYIEPTDINGKPFDNDPWQGWGVYTPFEFVDVDFDGEKELTLNDLCFSNHFGNRHQVYKLAGNIFVPFDIYPYDYLTSMTYFDFENKTIKQYILDVCMTFIQIYFSYPREQEWQLSELPDFQSYNMRYFIMIEDPQILALDSVKEYVDDTLYIYRRYGHSLRLTDKIPPDSPRYYLPFSF